MAVTPVTSFGIEYTFTADRDFTDIGSIISSVRSKIESAHCDGHQLEIPSPIHRDLKSAKKFYDKMMKVLAGMPLTPVRIDKLKNEEIYYGTGGGHIHLRIANGNARRENDIEYLTAYNLISFVYNSPWLNWVFNEFSDDQNANSLFSNPDARNLIKSGPQGPSHRDLNCPINQRSLNRLYFLRDVFYSKSYAVRIHRPCSWGPLTLEFRFFDAPKNWKQASEHLDFVMALFSRCKKLASKKTSILPRMTKQKMKTLKDRKTTERVFRDTIKMLGLDWRVYKKYMRNFDDRKAFGSMV